MTTSFASPSSSSLECGVPAMKITPEVFMATFRRLRKKFPDIFLSSFTMEEEMCLRIIKSEVLSTTIRNYHMGTTTSLEASAEIVLSWVFCVYLYTSGPLAENGRPPYELIRESQVAPDNPPRWRAVANSIEKLLYWGPRPASSTVLYHGVEDDELAMMGNLSIGSPYHVEKLSSYTTRDFTGLRFAALNKKNISEDLSLSFLFVLQSHEDMFATDVRDFSANDGEEEVLVSGANILRVRKTTYVELKADEDPCAEEVLEQIQAAISTPPKPPPTRESKGWFLVVVLLEQAGFDMTARDSIPKAASVDGKSGSVTG